MSTVKALNSVSRQVASKIPVPVRSKYSSSLAARTSSHLMVPARSEYSRAPTSVSSTNSNISSYGNRYNSKYSFSMRRFVEERQPPLDPQNNRASFENMAKWRGSVISLSNSEVKSSLLGSAQDRFRYDYAQHSANCRINPGESASQVGGNSSILENFDLRAEESSEVRYVKQEYQVRQLENDFSELQADLKELEGNANQHNVEKVTQGVTSLKDQLGALKRKVNYEITSLDIGDLNKENKKLVGLRESLVNLEKNLEDWDKNLEGTKKRMEDASFTSLNQNVKKMVNDIRKKEAEISVAFAKVKAWISILNEISSGITHTTRGN